VRDRENLSRWSEFPRMRFLAALGLSILDVLLHQESDTCFTSSRDTVDAVRATVQRDKSSTTLYWKCYPLGVRAKVPSTSVDGVTQGAHFP